jgi:hypothetical protein
MCLNDSSEKVRDLACMFFTELSKRSNNPVYNLLGDIISILSKSNSDLATSTIPGAPKMSRSLTQAEFQSTMTFLLSFVKKDKYVSSLQKRYFPHISHACLFESFSFHGILLIIAFYSQAS